MKNTLQIAAVFCLITVSACSKKNEDKAQSLPDREQAMQEPTVEKGPEPIGIDVCDAFLEKYRDCVAHMPQDIKEQMQRGLESTERAWRTAAANSKDPQSLAASCERLATSVAETTKAQGCTW